jgi:hypothetical protein
MRSPDPRPSDASGRMVQSIAVWRTRSMRRGCTRQQLQVHSAPVPSPEGILHNECLLRPVLPSLAGIERQQTRLFDIT